MQTLVSSNEPGASADEVLATVRLSPIHVSAHDRRAWLDLFTDDAIIEDPVGAAITQKHDGGLERFWDALIAPNPVSLEVRSEVVEGDDAIREVTIATELAPGVVGRVPAYLFYRTRLDGGVRRIERLNAHWSIAMIEYSGSGAWMAMLAQFKRMVFGLKPGWLYRYLTSSLRGVRTRGPRQLLALTAAVKARDVAALRACFVADDVKLRHGDRLGSSAADLFAWWPEGSELVLEAPIPAGWTTAARFRVEGPLPAQGIVIFEHAEDDARLRGARFLLA